MNVVLMCLTDIWTQTDASGASLLSDVSHNKRKWVSLSLKSWTKGRGVFITRWRYTRQQTHSAWQQNGTLKEEKFTPKKSNKSLRNSLLSAFCPQLEPKYEMNLCSHWLNRSGPTLLVHSGSGAFGPAVFRSSHIRSRVFWHDTVGSGTRVTRF